MLNATSPETIDRARSGDTVVIGKLYEQFHVSIFRYLYYCVGDIHTAEDLTSEVFLHMIRSLPNYRYQGVPFQAWLFRIAHNLAVDHIRKIKVSNNIQLEENLLAGDPDIDSTVETNLTSDHLRQALLKLNEYQRDVIILRFVSGMPIAQVAQTLNKTEDTVKGLQRRGLAALRRILADSEVAHA